MRANLLQSLDLSFDALEPILVFLALTLEQNFMISLSRLELSFVSSLNLFNLRFGYS